MEKLRQDYKKVTGEAFRYFYCPILFKDENTELCQAHIVNKAFPAASGAWTVQRKDVDNFYGCRFEADFTALEDAKRGDSLERVFSSKKLNKKLPPKFLLDGKEVEYCFIKGSVPSQFTSVAIEQQGEMIAVGLKIRPNELESAAGRKWDIEVSKDLRMCSLVSLLKAAHLTLFDMLGYRYVFSPAGEFLGRQILGKFFLDNAENDARAVAKNAASFFVGLASMVCLLLNSRADFRGTVEDKRVLVCDGSSGGFWALILFIKTGDLMHSVMVPAWDRIEAVPTFLDFLKNKNDLIHVALAQYRDGGWMVAKERTPLNWPKSGLSLIDEAGNLVPPKGI